MGIVVKRAIKRVAAVTGIALVGACFFANAALENMKAKQRMPLAEYIRLAQKTVVSEVKLFMAREGCTAGKKHGKEVRLKEWMDAKEILEKTPFPVKEAGCKNWMDFVAGNVSEIKVGKEGFSTVFFDKETKSYVIVLHDKIEKNAPLKIASTIVHETMHAYISEKGLNSGLKGMRVYMSMGMGPQYAAGLQIKNQVSELIAFIMEREFLVKTQEGKKETGKVQTEIDSSLDSLRNGTFYLNAVR